MALSPSIELFLRQKERGVGRINARAGGRAAALQPFAGNVAARYSGLQGQEQALGRGLSGALATTGTNLGAGITGALQGIQAPQQAVDVYGGGQAAMGAASGAAVGALSTADLQRLRSVGTAEEIYASALPRLAMLAGEAERRSFLADAQQELSDLALEEAARQQDDAIENARYEREFAYKVQQDKLDRQRQVREFKYERKQDRLTRRRQAQLDRLAQRAAAQEYGLSLAKETRYGAQAAETARHHRQTEAASARSAAETRRHHGATEAQAAKGGKGDKAFYDTREDVFKRAREYAHPKSKLSDPMPRSKAKARLWAEFGTLLVGRGYDRKTVNTLLERALDASY